MSLAEIKEKLIGKRQEYAIVIDRSAMDEDSRAVKLAFASDKAIEHWFGYLKLSMDKKCVRCERLASGAPLLLDHDPRKQIGVIENFSFDKDGMARAEVRFSRSAMGEEIYQDVKDGIRRNVSVGFMVHELALESEKEDIPTYRSDDWEPMEISIVSMPADISVGVGRSLKTEENNEDLTEPAPATREITKNNEVTMSKENEDLKPPVETVTRAKSDALFEAEEIRQFGEILGEQELAKDFISRGAKHTEFLAAVNQKRAASTPVPPKAPEQQAKEQGVELARSAYRGKLKSFKGERAQEIAFRAGMWLKAVLQRDAKAIEFCRQNGMEFRAHSSATNELGGVLVPEEFENVMIDLRIMYGVFRANAQVVPMNSDTQTRPRRTSGLTAYFVGDEQAITESSKGWDTVTLTAKELGVLTKYTQNLSDDSVIALADDLASEIAYAMTEKEDRCGFLGDGTSTYGGIVGLVTKLAAATASLVTGSGNAWSELTLNDHIYVVGKLPQFARKSGNVKWYCSHTYWANVMQKLALAAGGVTHAEIEGELRPVFLGRPVEIVEVLPTAEANSQIPVVYGNLAQAALFGDRRGVTIDTTNSHDTDFAKRLQSIRGTERFDINVHDVGDTSSAGPVVGLQTAAS